MVPDEPAVKLTNGEYQFPSFTLTSYYQQEGFYKCVLDDIDNEYFRSLVMSEETENSILLTGKKIFL